MPTERVQRRIDALLDQVDQAVDSLEWARVRELCDGVLRLDLDNEDAQAFIEAAGRETAIMLEPASDASPTITSTPPAAASSMELPESLAGGRTWSKVCWAKAARSGSIWHTTPRLIVTWRLA